MLKYDSETPKIASQDPNSSILLVLVWKVLFLQLEKDWTCLTFKGDLQEGHSAKGILDNHESYKWILIMYQ